MAILVAEDNPISAKLLVQILKRYDFDTILASNGVEALDIISKNSASIEIVITDVMMPEMDGLTLAAKIKASPLYSNIPVIICTVLKDPDSIKKAAAIGCKHYLLKPFRPEDLRAKVLECRRHEKKVLRPQAEIMSHYHLKEDQYTDLKAAFLQLIEGYISLMDEKPNSGNNGELYLTNIHESAVIFGAERLNFFIEQKEKRTLAGIDDSEVNQALLNEMNHVIKTLSK